MTFKDENLGEEMIDIIRGLHDLVPTVEDLGGEEQFDRVPVVGDQKTMERGVEAQFSVRNAYTKRRKLEGLFFQLADWHHENKFLAVSRLFILLLIISPHKFKYTNSLCIYPGPSCSKQG